MEEESLRRFGRGSRVHKQQEAEASPLVCVRFWFVPLDDFRELSRREPFGLSPDNSCFLVYCRHMSFLLNIEKAKVVPAALRNLSWPDNLPGTLLSMENVFQHRWMACSRDEIL